MVSRKPSKIAGLVSGRIAATSVHRLAIGPTHGIATPTAATRETTTIAGQGCPRSEPPSREQTVTTTTATSTERIRAPYGPWGAPMPT
jgi:hypothetical protein